LNIAKKALRSTLHLMGLELKGDASAPIAFPVELSTQERDFFVYVRDNNLSMASDERLFTTMLACKHVVERDIEGDFLECGVWRGGNAVLAAAIFKLYGSRKKVYLFDTFAGMTKPTDLDRYAATGRGALQEFRDHQKESHNDWCYASIDDVRNSFLKVDLLSDNVVFVKGDVLTTLAESANIPAHISVLRLDTDWYESTKKELEVLYPLLSRGGALIIDDYGHWAGSKKATDEYFKNFGGRPLLQYTDYTGRAGIKLG
jgi:O-methyltransferase